MNPLGKHAPETVVKFIRSNSFRSLAYLFLQEPFDAGFQSRKLLQLRGAHGAA